MSQNGIRVYKHKIRRELVMERGERASVRVVKELDLSSTGVMLRAGSNPVLPNGNLRITFFSAKHQGLTQPLGVFCAPVDFVVILIFL